MVHGIIARAHHQEIFNMDGAWGDTKYQNRNEKVNIAGESTVNLGD